MPKRAATVAEIWSEYEALIPKEAPATQFRETKRAFYAGAAGLLGLVLENLSEGDECEEADLDMLMSVHNELNQFVQDVSKGEA